MDERRTTRNETQTHTNKPTSSIPDKKNIQEQNAIGWDHALRGRLALLWQNTQKCIILHLSQQHGPTK